MHIVRRATAADLSFMQDMLYEAATVGWMLQGIDPPARGDVLAHPSNRRYLDGWDRLGDAGLIVDDAASNALGAAWYRLFAPSERGDGIIAVPRVPEIAIGVVPEARGRGVGAALLQGLLRVAREDGFERLGLSVDPANPARRLYVRCGFREMPAGNPHAGTSILMEADTR